MQKRYKLLVRQLKRKQKNIVLYQWRAMIAYGPKGRSTKYTKYTEINKKNTRSVTFIVE